jgi:hypothetical protein
MASHGTRVALGLLVMYTPMVAISMLTGIEPRQFFLAGTVFVFVTFPLIQRAAVRKATRLSTPAWAPVPPNTRFFVADSPELNAWTFQSVYGNAIIVTSGLLKAPKDVVRGVVHHELAHVRFNHFFIGYGLVLAGLMAVFSLAPSSEVRYALAVFGTLVLAMDLVGATTRRRDSGVPWVALGFVGLLVLVDAAAIWTAKANGAGVHTLSVANGITGEVWLWIAANFGIVACTCLVSVFTMELWSDVWAGRRMDMRPTTRFFERTEARIGGVWRLSQVMWPHPSPAFRSWLAARLARRGTPL